MCFNNRYGCHHLLPEEKFSDFMTVPDPSPGVSLLLLLLLLLLL
jgi:hypothetical protein